MDQTQEAAAISPQALQEGRKGPSQAKKESDMQTSKTEKKK